MSGRSAPFAPNRDGRFAFVSYTHTDLDSWFQYLTPLADEGYRFWFDAGLTPTVE